MSYEVIEKNEYGVLVFDNKSTNCCGFCKYKETSLEDCIKLCGSETDYYYLPDQESAKLDSQKELIDLQNENKQLKEIIKEFEGILKRVGDKIF